MQFTCEDTSSLGGNYQRAVSSELRSQKGVGQGDPRAEGRDRDDRAIETIRRGKGHNLAVSYGARATRNVRYDPKNNAVGILAIVVGRGVEQTIKGFGLYLFMKATRRSFFMRRG